MISKKVTTVLAVIDRYRIYLLLLLVFGVMSCVAPRFLNTFNMTVIMKSMCLNATVAIGFTLVLLSGELDLSIGSSVTLGAMLTIGLQPQLGWIGSVTVALVAGALVGLVNGLLVMKARINSFIATLATMTILQGIIYIYSHGSSLSVTTDSAFALADMLEKQIAPWVTPLIIITLALVFGSQAVLSWTKWGRNFFLVGGNKETAWFSGVSPTRYIVAAFMVSGVMSALGGALCSMAMCSATTDLGAACLMDVIAATIVGGTAMAGGKGSIVRSAVAVLMFAMLFNGFNRLGYPSELKVLVAGLVLALVVIHEAVMARRRERVRGQRPILMDELRTTVLNKETTT